MENLFYHGWGRMSDLTKRVQDDVTRACMYEALECMAEAFRGEISLHEQTQKELERLQKRYDKLKGE